jgi:hypothetical protein
MGDLRIDWKKKGNRWGSGIVRWSDIGWGKGWWCFLRPRKVGDGAKPHVSWEMKA